MPFIRMLSIMFWTLLPFDCPPVSMIPNARIGWLLAAAGTAALTIIVPPSGMAVSGAWNDGQRSVYSSNAEI